jgi:hypothetical protein
VQAAGDVYGGVFDQAMPTCVPEAPEPLPDEVVSFPCAGGVYKHLMVSCLAIVSGSDALIAVSGSNALMVAIVRKEATAVWLALTQWFITTCVQSSLSRCTRRKCRVRRRVSIRSVQSGEITKMVSLFPGAHASCDVGDMRYQ